MTRARKPAKPPKGVAPPTPDRVPESLTDAVHRHAMFVAWLERIRSEVHWVQDELERNGPTLRGVLPESDKRAFIHELDMMWSTLSQVIPAERPREFVREGGAL